MVMRGGPGGRRIKIDSGWKIDLKLLWNWNHVEPKTRNIEVLVLSMTWKKLVRYVRNHWTTDPEYRRFLIVHRFIFRSQSWRQEAVQKHPRQKLQNMQKFWTKLKKSILVTAKKFKEFLSEFRGTMKLSNLQPSISYWPRAIHFRQLLIKIIYSSFVFQNRECDVGRFVETKNSFKENSWSV